MAELTFNLQGLPPHIAKRVIATIRSEDAAAYALGVIEQRRLKQWYDNAAVAGLNTDIGRQNMVMSHGQRLAAYRQYGQMCFADPDFAPFLLRKHEDYRVKDVGTRVQSGFTGKGHTCPKAKVQSPKLARRVRFGPGTLGVGP